MAKIYRTINKETFVPEKNYFKVEKVEVCRDETPEEVLYEKKSNTYASSAWLIGCVGGAIIFVASIILGSFGLLLPCFGLVLLLIPLFIIVKKLFDTSDSYEEKLNKFYNEFGAKLWDEATAELYEYNKQQYKIAEEWRAQHPFEEKIRAVLADPKSSVDVAEMAYFFAEKYLKEKVGD